MDENVVLQFLQAPATSTISAGSIVAFIIILILRGQLLPKAWIAEQFARYEAEIERERLRGNEWKQIAEERLGQINELSIVLRTANHTFESLPTGGGDDNPPN